MSKYEVRSHWFLLLHVLIYLKSPCHLLVTRETKCRSMSYQHAFRALSPAPIRRAPKWRHFWCSGNRLLPLYYRVSLSNFYWFIKHTNTSYLFGRPLIIGNGKEFYYLQNDIKFFDLRWIFPKLWRCRWGGSAPPQQLGLLYWSAIRNCGRLLSKIIQLKLGWTLHQREKYISCFTILHNILLCSHSLSCYGTERLSNSLTG